MSDGRERKELIAALAAGREGLYWDNAFFYHAINRLALLLQDSVEDLARQAHAHADKRYEEYRKELNNEW